MIRYALAYARKDWCVVPAWWPVDASTCACVRGAGCDSIGKHPIPKQWQTEATSDPSAIRDWWHDYPEANISITTGRARGIWVLDIDSKHDGIANARRLFAQHNYAPNTICAETGSGGRHLFYRYPEAARISNRISIVPGVDVRGDNGQVIAPPSLHALGTQYTWVAAPGKVPLADAPQWLLDLVTTPERKPREHVQDGKPKPKLNPDTVPMICNGARNDTLFKLAARIRWQGDDETYALEMIGKLNLAKCQPPLRDREVETLVRSAYRYT